MARDLALGLTAELASGSDLAWDLHRARDVETRQRSSDLSLLQTSWLQELFFPNLSQSWPALELQGIQGKIGDAVLTAPASFRFDLSGRLVLFADQQGSEPLQLSQYKYDLCFPMTAIPVGPLRREFPAWREDRRYRALGVLPFLIPDLGNLWQTHATLLFELFPIGEIYALLPVEKLWYKPFAEWTSKDWREPGHRSLLWDIGNGTVVAVEGVHHRDTTRSRGVGSVGFA